MVNFKVGEEMRSDVHVINMSRARDKEKFWVPDKNWTFDLPYTGRML